ncbi:MAG: amidohydrolase, partial [Candidatus Neomarinimicrobiota bacterium]|nr:amidohydrolase [Candidatus Neomarinimicrobiota bacterium]
MIKKLPFLLLTFSCSVQNVDKIYYNGVIWTGDSNNPSATALAVSGDQIIFVGADSDALVMATENTKKIDLSSRFVTPGLIDNHVHIMSGGFQL